MTGSARDEDTPQALTRELRCRLMHRGELTLAERLAIGGVLDTAIAMVHVARTGEHDITGIGVLAETVDQLAALCAAGAPLSEEARS